MTIKKRKRRTHLWGSISTMKLININLKKIFKNNENVIVLKK